MVVCLLRLSMDGNSGVIMVVGSERPGATTLAPLASLKGFEPGRTT